MKIKQSLCCSLAVILLIFSCSNPNKNNKPIGEGEKSFVLKGNLKNFQGKYLVLNGLNLEEQRWMKIDSTKPKENGDFEFQIKKAIPDFYVLRINDSISQSVIADNAEIIFSADIKDFENTKLFEYSEASIAMEKFSKTIVPYTNELKNISKIVNQLIQKGKFDSISQYQQKFEESKEKIKKEAKTFINQNKNSLVVFALIDQFNFEQDFGFLDTLSQDMSKTLPLSKYTKMLSGQFEKIKKMQETSEVNNKLNIGQAAPDFELNTPEAKKIKLSSFKGKYLLLDFWASWCKPCRAENPNVVKAYEKYKTKNFDVLSVSLDQDKNAWLKAISEDKMVWNHVSDLGGWESAVVPLFGIESIPSTYLLDKEGNIIASNLRGEALEQKLSEILK